MHKNNKKVNSKTATKNAVLITGAAKRIGREIAIFLAQSGFDVAISYNNSKSEAEKLSQEISRNFAVKCQIFKADLSNQKQVEDLGNQVIKVFPHLNLLINNASIFRKSKFINSSCAEMQENMNIHFFSPFILAQKFAKNVILKKIKNAQIINLIDKNIVRFDTQYFHYLLSKKSLAELTKMLALELAPQIRVNGISPGFILNPIDSTVSLESIAATLKKIPLQRKGDPKNIIQAVEFFLKNDFLSGQIIAVDGAASLNHAG